MKSVSVNRSFGEVEQAVEIKTVSPGKSPSVKRESVDENSEHRDDGGVLLEDSRDERDSLPKRQLSKTHKSQRVSPPRSRNPYDGYSRRYMPSRSYHAPPPHYGYDYRPPPHGYAPPPMHPGQAYPYHPPSYHGPYGAYPPPPPYPQSTGMPAMKSSDSVSSKSSKKKRSMDWESDRPRHRREFSGASTASTLSVGAMSMQSHERGPPEDNPMIRASPKRRRGQDGQSISVDTSMDERDPTINEAERFEKLTVNDTSSFLCFDTSPINGADVEATPVSKNTKRQRGMREHKSKKHGFDEKDIDRDSDTPTPPLPTTSSNDGAMNDEMNRHLRGQTFTPLPNIERDPSFNIQHQLSWSIAGDDPSLGDLGEWELEKKRPPSTTSQGSNLSRGIALSPHSFTLWREDDPNNQNRTASRDDSIKLSVLSPNSDNEEIGVSGTTTPLPFIFGEERENAVRRTFSNKSDKSIPKEPHPHQPLPENVNSIFVKRGGSLQSKSSRGPPKSHWGPSRPMRMPPHGYMDEYGRGPTGRDGPPPPMPEYYHSYGPPPHPHMMQQNDRIRNLRGRAPPHHAPMHYHMPPHAMQHHNHQHLTSPLAPGKNGMWGPPPPPPVPTSIDLNPSKRKCVPLKPPIPPKFQGDADKWKTAQVPEFTSLVNFPAHMSQKQSVNLPEGMRCCVMCGQACPCSTGGKNKKKKELAPRNSHDADNKQPGFAIIPTQNKGLCTLCDVNVWVVCQSGLEIKWCKGCKNFRPWAAFGDKGLATKCLRCRERQREKYALQKEEKEKARLLAKQQKGLKV